MFRWKRLRCSFCGKRDADVAKLVAGPRVFICDECVAVASRLMHEADTSMPDAQGSLPKTRRRFTLRFWHWAFGIGH